MIAVRPVDIARAVGAELRRMRRRAGLTHEQVALAIDSYRPIIGRIERGVHLPTLATCVAYAAVTGGSLREVWRAVDRACGWPAPARRARVSARASRPCNPVELAA